MAKIYTSTKKNKSLDKHLSFVDKFFLSYTAEEEWLNEMCSRGMHLVRKTFYRYYFTTDVNNDVKYSVEILEHPADNPLSATYIAMKQKNGYELVAAYKNRAYFKTTSENYIREGAERARQSRRKSVAYMFASFLIAFITCVVMLSYHCVSSLNFRIERSTETMSALTKKMPFFGFFEKIARFIQLDSLLGDYQSTSVAVLFFMAVVILSVPTAVYLRELIITKRNKKSSKSKRAK